MIRLLIPLVAMAIALVLFLRRPASYVGFTIWVWLLTPLVRRLVDYRLGWVEPNFILLAPFLVAAVSGLSLLRKGKGRSWSHHAPFVLCGLAVLYGFSVGMLTRPSGEVIYALFNWFSPIIFGMYLATDWEHYPELSRVLQRSLVLGVLATGVYGLYQFFAAPPWDVFWLRNISTNQIDPSFGQPVPLGIRVWSSLNGPGPFANVMMAGLLLLFASPSRWKLPASLAGYSAFLLSVVRTAWLSWGIGIVLLLRGEKPGKSVKLGASLVVLGLCLVPILQNPQIAPVLSDRLKTFTHLSRDESFRERKEMYQVVTDIATRQPWGHGLLNNEIDRNLVVDSGLLILLLQLGWAGTLLYLAGIASFLLRPVTAMQDCLPRVLKVICISLLAQLVGGQIFSGVTGAVFWWSLGLCVGADQFHAQAGRPLRNSPTLVPHTVAH